MTGKQLTCPACHGATRCQLPIGHEGEHVGPQHLYLPNMPRVRWADRATINLDDYDGNGRERD
jgi:hypothetical protein